LSFSHTLTRLEYPAARTRNAGLHILICQATTTISRDIAKSRVDATRREWRDSIKKRMFDI